MQYSFEEQVNAVNHARKIMTSMEHDAVLNDAANTIRGASIYTEIAECKQARTESLEAVLSSIKLQLNTVHTAPPKQDHKDRYWLTGLLVLSVFGILFIIEHLIKLFI